MSEGRSENLISQSWSLLAITHSSSSEKSSSSQLPRAASVLCALSSAIAPAAARQLCTAVQGQLDSTASTEKQGPRKSSKCITKSNSSLCIIFAFHTNVKESSIAEEVINIQTMFLCSTLLEQLLLLQLMTTLHHSYNPHKTLVNHQFNEDKNTFMWPSHSPTLNNTEDLRLL